MGMNRKLKRAKEKTLTIEGVKINVKGFDPKINISEYLSIFNLRIKRLKPLAEEVIRDMDERGALSRFLFELSEDNMFSEDSIKTVKEYVSIINEIGALLPEKIENKMTEEDLKNFYEESMKFNIYMQLYYKFLWLMLESKVKSQEDYKMLVDNIIPESIRTEYPNFKDYIHDYLSPHFLPFYSTDLEPKIFEACASRKIENAKAVFIVGIENTKQKELEDDYIIQQAKKVIRLSF